MSCKDIYEFVKANELKIRKNNAAAESLKQDMPTVDPQQVQDRMVHLQGQDEELVKSKLNNASGTLEGDTAVGMEVQRLTANAKSVVQSLFKEGKPPSPGQIKELWGNVRDVVRAGIERSVNFIPKGLNKEGQHLLEVFSGYKTAMQIGSDKKIVVGEFRKTMLDHEIPQLYNQYKSSTAAPVSKDAFEYMLFSYANGRSESVEARTKMIKDYRERISNQRGVIKNQGMLDLAERGLGLMEDAMKNKHITDFVDGIYNDLDVIGEQGKVKELFRETYNEEGDINPQTRKNYFPNIVAMQKFYDGWGKTPYDKSNFKGAKKYENAFDAMIGKDGKEGIAPASTNFSEVMGEYYKAVGNAFRKERLKKSIETDASLNLSEAKKYKISVSADEEVPAFYKKQFGKDFEPPKGHKYLTLENLGGQQFEGIYAHEQVYRSLENSFKIPHTEGFAKAAKDAHEIVKQSVLSLGGMYHAKSIASGAASLLAATGSKIKLQDFTLVWKDGSLMHEGLSKLDKNHKDFGKTLKLIENGFGMGVPDMMKMPVFARSYAMKTGNTTVMTKIGDALRAIPEWEHGWLFGSWQTGTKLGTAHRIMETKWYKNQVKRLGSEDDAMKLVSKMCNDHFGGHNYEAMGRGKMTQSILQTFLLAPSWQEAKLRRLGGTVLAQDPAMRKAYIASLGVQLTLATMGGLAMRFLYNQITGQKESWDDVVSDFKDGKLTSVRINRIKEKGKPDKIVYANLGGNENQDARRVIGLLRSVYDGFNEGDFQTTSDFMQGEAEKSGSPISSMLLAAHDRNRTQAITKSPKKEPILDTMKRVLPMDLGDTIDAYQGKYGATTPESKTLSALGSIAATQIGGATISTKREEAKKKGKKKEKTPIRVIGE